MAGCGIGGIRGCPGTVDGSLARPGRRSTRVEVEPPKNNAIVSLTPSPGAVPARRCPVRVGSQGMSRSEPGAGSRLAPVVGGRCEAKGDSTRGISPDRSGLARKLPESLLQCPHSVLRTASALSCRTHLCLCRFLDRAQLVPCGAQLVLRGTRSGPCNPQSLAMAPATGRYRRSGPAAGPAQCHQE